MLKKILAAFLTAVIASSALCVAASADYDKITVVNPKKVTSGKQMSGTAKYEKVYDYKIVLGEKGTLKVSSTMDVSGYDIYLYHQNGSTLESVTGGKLEITSKSTYSSEYKNNKGTMLLGAGVRIYKESGYVGPAGTLTFKNLDKGTYYLRFTIGSYVGPGSGKFTFTATFPEGSDSSDKSDSDGGEFELAIVLDEGDKLSLAAVVGTKNKSVEWSTSNKNVATVTAQGKVKAKKEGTAVITAKSGNTKKTIKIIVED